MRRAAWLVWAVVAFPATAGGQGSLSDAADGARRAWLAHDAPGLVGSSSSLVLQLPGADPSSALGRAQAAELLRRFWRSAEERGLDVVLLREVEPGRGFAEMARRYVVAGTSDVRVETLFLGFRLVGERWALTELRTAP